MSNVFKLFFRFFMLFVRAAVSFYSSRSWRQLSRGTYVKKSMCFAMRSDATAIKILLKKSKIHFSKKKSWTLAASLNFIKVIRIFFHRQRDSEFSVRQLWLSRQILFVFILNFFHKKKKTENFISDLCWCALFFTFKKLCSRNGRSVAFLGVDFKLLVRTCCVVRDIFERR